MGRPHTTIGAERFHFRVRNGIGWYPLAIAARKPVGALFAIALAAVAPVNANIAPNKITIWISF